MTDWNDREVFTEAEFAEVRGRVLGEVRRRRRAWAAAYAAAAAIVVMVCGLWTWRLSRVETLPVAARVLPAPPPAVERPVRTETPRVARTRQHVKRERPAPPGPRKEEPVEPLLVKLETPDPDVVIYWIVEEKGDTE